MLTSNSNVLCSSNLSTEKQQQSTVKTFCTGGWSGRSCTTGRYTIVRQVQFSSVQTLTRGGKLSLDKSVCCCVPAEQQPHDRTGDRVQLFFAHLRDSLFARDGDFYIVLYNCRTMSFRRPQAGWISMRGAEMIRWLSTTVSLCCSDDRRGRPTCMHTLKFPT